MSNKIEGTACAPRGPSGEGVLSNPRVVWYNSNAIRLPGDSRQASKSRKTIPGFKMRLFNGVERQRSSRKRHRTDRRAIAAHYRRALGADKPSG